VDVCKLIPYEYLHLMMPPIFKKLIVNVDPLKDKKTYFWQSTLAGALATFTYMVYLYPFDVLRVRVGSDIGFR